MKLQFAHEERCAADGMDRSGVATEALENLATEITQANLQVVPMSTTNVVVEEGASGPHVPSKKKKREQGQGNARGVRSKTSKQRVATRRSLNRSEVVTGRWNGTGVLISGIQMREYLGHIKTHMDSNVRVGKCASDYKTNLLSYFDSWPSSTVFECTIPQCSLCNLP